jgi:hypothetical protein
METKTIGELPRNLLLVTDSQESTAVKEHIGPAADDYDSFFVAMGEGEYTEVWGFEGIVPWNWKTAWRIQ